MGRKLNKIVFSLLVAVFCTGALPAETLIYKEVTGNDTVNLSFTVTPNNTGYLLKGTAAGKDFIENRIIEMDKELSTVSWNYSNSREKTEITSKKEETRLLVNGKFKNKKYSKAIAIEKYPLKQMFPYSLESFVRSNENSLIFWIVNPADMEPVNMIASKKSVETITLNGKPVETWFVRITITGWKGKLWHANAWFRKADGRYLKYVGAKGPPGAPLCTITLAEEK